MKIYILFFLLTIYSNIYLPWNIFNVYSIKYCYQFPSWSSDSKSIYVLKRVFADDEKNNSVQTIKIKADKKTLTESELVEEYLKSAAAGDIEYSKCISGYTEEEYFLRNFRLTGYSILDSGKGFVDTINHYINKDHSIYKFQKNRYYVGGDRERIYILYKRVLENIDLVTENNAISLIKNDGIRNEVINISDIDKEYLSGKINCINSAAYGKKTNRIYFSLQSYSSENVPQGFLILTVDLSQMNKKGVDVITKETSPAIPQ